MTTAQFESRFCGALLGTFVGDAAGESFEAASPQTVAATWGQVAPGTANWRGRYTDDTQMMIGVGESLIACGGLDPADMARRFVQNFEERRGYGMGACNVLCALRDGVPWDRAATSVFPDGSFGNGAAMRVAPVGVLYHHDAGQLRRAAELSASITHAHPLGREGAALQAWAVALALQSELESFDPADFLGRLRTFVRPDLDEYVGPLLAIERMLSSDPAIDEVITTLGNDVRAHRAVPAAIYCFLVRHESFPDAVTYAVHLGGDTDTIGAMTGAIAGALHGLQGIPSRWREGLENQGKGRDYVLGLASQLANVHARIRR